MCRPLNDKVAELEAKYSSCMLCDLKERKHTIEGFDHDIDYLFKSFEKYKEDVKFVLNHKLDLDIIRRATLNLVLILQQLCESVIPYRNSIEFYLLDEQYEKHSDLYYRFRETENKLEEFLERLKLHNVFNENNLDYSDVMSRFEIFDENYDPEKCSVPCIIQINANEIKKMDTAELLLGLNRQLNILNNNLWCLKMNLIEHDTEINKEIYELNYLLYAKSYWPSRVNNFRSHIEMQKLRANVDIAGLEKLRHETTHEFEYHTETGKIWRDYSEDIPQMVIQMKKTIKQEEQWEYFFKTIFELEEFDRWIEELRNPPESDEDKQKRELLLRSNKVFNLKPSKSKYKVDILLLYYFIKDRFITEKMYIYEWYALFYILRRVGVLTNCTTEGFVEQMNDEAWFANVKKKCSANEINTYNTFLTERSPESWDVKYKPEGNRASNNAINNLIRKYLDLEDTIDEIYIKE